MRVQGDRERERERGREGQLPLEKPCSSTHLSGIISRSFGINGIISGITGCHGNVFHIVPQLIEALSQELVSIL